MSEVTEQGDPSSIVSKSQKHFEDNQNDLKLIMCMVVGLKDKDGNLYGDCGKDSRFPKKGKKKYNPSNQMLIDEIKRRKKILDPSQEPKANSQMLRTEAIEWLQKNPLQDSTDQEFIQSKLDTFLATSTNAEAEKQSSTNQNSRDQWSGMIPFLRLIHCLLDCDKIREAYHKSFTTMNKEELDGRNNPERMCECPWVMAVDKWNDEKYSVKSTVYQDLHDDFRQSINLDFESVKGMGTLTPDKAKSKSFKLKNELDL